MATDNAPDEDTRLANAVAKGLKQFVAEREEEEAKKNASGDGDGKNNDGGSGDKTGKRSFAEWLLGGSAGR